MSSADGYGIDLSQISLADFKDQLKTEDLLPSQQVLLEGIDERFETLEKMGLKTLQGLVEALKTKPRLVRFTADSGIDSDYLTVLRRKARGYLSNPVKICDIPGLDSAVVAALEEEGIKHTRHYFKLGMTPANRAELAAKTDLHRADLETIAGLTDLARVGYFGSVFIKLIFDAGVYSVRDLIECDLEDLMEQLQLVRTEQRLTTPLPDLEDLSRCVENARMLPEAYESD